MEILKFPKNFLWGAATSSHQIEGNNHNDWSEWEKSEERVGELKKKGLNPDDFISGQACDSYNRYEEDFNIAKSLNHNAHRFSIEWSRVEPEEGKFDDQAIQHYKRVVKSIRDRGMEPIVTLWHFSNPVWFAEQGGWLNPKAPERFVRFIKVAVDNLKDDVKIWVTLNEAATVYAGTVYIGGHWIVPGQYKKGILVRLSDYFRARRHFAEAHTLAYRAIKDIYVSPDQKKNPEFMSHNVEVGFAENNVYQPLPKNLLWRILGRLYINHRNFYLAKKTFPHYDFMGLNYYHIDRRVPGTYKVVPRQDWWAEYIGWEFYPPGIYHCLMDLKKRFNKPVYITENGLPNANDDRRLEFIKKHLIQVHKAIQDGVDVRGYLYWSLLDNLELWRGYDPRFGLVEVDFKTFERKIRPSAYEYAKIIKENQLEI